MLRSITIRHATTLLFIVVVGFIYYFVPNAKVRFRDVWVGALVTGLLWKGALEGFSWYMRDMSRFTRVNGSIAAVVVFLVWVYIQAVILLYGVYAVRRRRNGSAHLVLLSARRSPRRSSAPRRWIRLWIARPRPPSHPPGRQHESLVLAHCASAKQGDLEHSQAIPPRFSQPARQPATWLASRRIERSASAQSSCETTSRPPRANSVNLP